MGLALRPGISFCDVGGRLVFLDIVADRYFCLDADIEEAFRQMMSADAAPTSLSTLLSRTGLLHDSNGPTCIRPFAPRSPATDSLLDGPPTPCHPMRIVDTLIRLAIVRRALRRGGFCRLVSQLTADKAKLQIDTARPTEALRHIAIDFKRTRRLVRSHDQCLARSLALAQQCLWAGQRVDLVIGVRLRPFAAHSWVQADSLLVNDQLETVRTYTPVLAL